MNHLRKLGLVAVTTLLSIGVLGITAPVHADTSWGCPACKTTGR